MRMLAFTAVLILLVLTGSPALADGLDIQVVDGRISIHAEAVPLGRLLGLLDRVAGTESTVPSEFENRNVSVWFQELDRRQAVRKIFEGLSLDYAVLGGDRIVVTAASRSLPIGSSIPAVAGNPVPVGVTGQPQAGTAAAQSLPGNPFQMANPGNPNEDPNSPPGAPVQPAIIQTPFGPLVNPRAAQPGTPLSGPGQGFPFGAGVTGAAVPGSGVSPIPGRSPNDAAPGTPPTDIFGNRRPAMLDLNRPQPTASPNSQP